MDNNLTDEQILVILGKRIAQLRLERNLPQSELAYQAGVSKQTVERLEAGKSVQLTNLIRLCRALDLMEGFERLIPGLQPSPIAQLKIQSKTRQRARATRNKNKHQSDAVWSWENNKK